MNEYVTFEALKKYTGIEDGNVEDDDLLMELCEDASRAFDTATCRRFYPRIETRYYDDPADSRLLKLDDDLLALTSLTTANGTDTISTSNCYLMKGTDYNATPYDRIALKQSEGDLFYYSNTPQKATTVVGTWGYHDDWSNAWLDSNDTVQDDPLTTDSATLTVGDVDGGNLYGVTPRFQVGQTLKIDSEWMYVTDKPSGTTLTVRRGINGSTAAQHDNASTVYVYQPPRKVVSATRRLATFLYRQKDSSVFDTTAFPELGMVQAPAGTPKDVLRAMLQYKHRLIK